MLAVILFSNMTFGIGNYCLENHSPNERTMVFRIIIVFMLHHEYSHYDACSFVIHRIWFRGDQFTEEKRMNKNQYHEIGAEIAK